MASVVVFISRVIGSARASGPFAELEVFSSDSVARLAKRACTEFPLWRVDASQVELYLAAAGGDDEPSTDSIKDALSGTRLQSGWSLARAGIAAGSWLLVRVPAAAGGGTFDIQTAFAQFKTDLLAEIAAGRTPKPSSRSGGGTPVDPGELHMMSSLLEPYVTSKLAPFADAQRLQPAGGSPGT